MCLCLHACVCACICMCVCKYACASVSLLLTRSAQVEDAQKNLLEVRRFRGAFLTRMKHALVELEDSQGFNLLITCFIIGNISFMAVGVFVSRCFAFILDGVLGTHSLMTSFHDLFSHDLLSCFERGKFPFHPPPVRHQNLPRFILPRCAPLVAAKTGLRGRLSAISRTWRSRTLSKCPTSFSP